MKKATKLTAAALAATLSLSLAACGSSASTSTASTSASADGVVYRTLDEIKADGTINIGVFSDKNPFGYVDENGEYQGYDIYFANRLAEDLGVKVNYVSTESANRIEYLQTGKVGHAGTRRGGRFCAALHERCTGRRFPGLQRHHVAGQLECR